MQVLIPNALQPAEVEEGSDPLPDVGQGDRAGARGSTVLRWRLVVAAKNVRLGSKLCGWDIEIMTREELDQEIERAVGWLRRVAREGRESTSAWQIS